MADPFAYETYAGREGQTFRMDPDEDPVDATLVSVTPHGTEATPGFALLFVAPGAVREQRIHAFDHSDLGRIEIFVVPVGRTDAGIEYEAAFSRSPAAP